MKLTLGIRQDKKVVYIKTWDVSDDFSIPLLLNAITALIRVWFSKHGEQYG